MHIFSSRARWFVSLVIAFVLGELIGIYFGLGSGAIVGTTAFIMYRVRTYNNSFPAKKFSIWSEFREKPIDKVGEENVIQDIPTQTEFDALTPFEKFTYRHHALVFWGGITLALIIIGLVWYAGNLNSVFGF